MAKGRLKKKRALVRFEFGLGGLLGVGIVFFCIFLWMFLLGIWVGQTLLQSEGGLSGSSGTMAAVVSSLWQKGRGAVAELENGEPSSGFDELVAGKDGTADREAEPEQSGQSFFTLQAGAFSDEKKAMQATLAWRARGHDAFYLPPDEEKDDLYRVFIGKFGELNKANAKAEELKKSEKIHSYITLLPAANFPKR